MKLRAIEKILAIETSCDDTSVAIVRKDGWVDSLVSASQDKDHEIFGGIVPEIASRNHIHHLLPLVEIAFEKAKLTWNDIDAVCVTVEPGLMGSLLVGAVTAKTLAIAKEKPLLGVNHLEGHLLAPFLRDATYSPPENFNYPFVALAVSGGHTSLYWVEGLGKYKVLGHTIDDAAGEAFDKFAKVLGLGFPGGVLIDKHASGGDPTAFSFPRSLMQKGNLQFSFSGLKASGQREVEKFSKTELKKDLKNICASYQEAIVDTLLTKLDWAVKQECDGRQISRKAIITGGVSANSRLRAKAEEWAKTHNVQLVIPPIRYCTDNAAMIGYAGIQRMNQGEKSDAGMGVSASSTIVV